MQFADLELAEEARREAGVRIGIYDKWVMEGRLNSRAGREADRHDASDCGAARIRGVSLSEPLKARGVRKTPAKP